MARDSAVGRERVLIVPGSLALDAASNQHAGVSQGDINQQIMEVRVSSLNKILSYLTNLKINPG